MKIIKVAGTGNRWIVWLDGHDRTSTDQILCNAVEGLYQSCYEELGIREAEIFGHGKYGSFGLAVLNDPARYGVKFSYDNSPEDAPKRPGR